jgi:hypothetical protein
VRAGGAEVRPLSRFSVPIAPPNLVLKDVGCAWQELMLFGIDIVIIEPRSEQ